MTITSEISLIWEAKCYAEASPVFSHVSVFLMPCLSPCVPGFAALRMGILAAGGRGSPSSL